ncbi:flagellar protein FlaG [Marinobacter sp. X15-166B]|uniref:flagellar protein FlaG n=1 Tax=Marinobacter sp. X15-166B TaxID=1897620 RepID=UPI00085C920B|nr:flagellar protein FlaG [Marinobacter sp. X15-166B]OEY65133.1 flagellar biosynthesis protein FlaG [Marinobacter sp. X15-166B]
MNDVNLNGSGLRLVGAGDTARAGAMSSSKGKAEVVSDGSSTSADKPASSLVVSQPQEPSKGEQLQARNETQREELGSAVSQLNDYVQNVQRDLQFEVDHERGQTIVRVVDQQTQQVIRQIPDEVAVRLAENLQQDEPLTLFNIKV